jgi:hypothetical protein
MPDRGHEICFVNYQLQFKKEMTMGLGTILLVILIMMLIGAIPSWPHSKNWGYGPSGGIGIIVIFIIVLLLTGRI